MDYVFFVWDRHGRFQGSFQSNGSAKDLLPHLALGSMVQSAKSFDQQGRRYDGTHTDDGYMRLRYADHAQ